MYVKSDLFGFLRNSAFAGFISSFLALVLLVIPLQRIAAQTRPTPNNAGAGAELAFLAGNWKVKYTDQLLGEVTGYAVVERMQPDGQLLVRYTVEDPRTRQRHEMIALDVRRNRNVLELSFFGTSPSAAAGGEAADASVPSKAAYIEAAAGTKVTVSLDGAKEDATVAAPPVSAAVPPVQSQLLLRFPFGDATAGRNRLDGQWLVRRHWQQGFDGVRTGNAAKETEWKAAFEEAADVMRGGETWERSGPQIDSVNVAEMEHFGRVANVDPSYFRDRAKLTSAWLRIEGRELPVRPNEKVEAVFADPNVTYTGGHRPDPKVAGALQIEVDLNKNIKPGPKEFTLNGSGATWEFDFPGLQPKEIRYVRRIERGGQYEATNVLYLGEIYYIEVEFPYAPFYDERKFMTLAEVPVAFEVAKLRAQPKVFRSQPMLLLEHNSPQPNDGDFTAANDPNRQGQPAVVRASEGAMLATTPADAILPGAKPSVGVAEVVDAVEGRYQQALALAKAIREQYTDRENYKVSVFIVTDELKALVQSAGVAKRGTPISIQDHAALILLHEEMLKRVERFSVDLRRNLPVSLPQGHPSIAKYWQKQKAGLVQALSRAAANNRDAPLFQFKVAAPSGGGEIWLWQALTDYTRDSMPGNAQEKEQRFREYATWAVIDTERQLSKKTFQALHLMSTADIRKPNELLVFARIGYDTLAPLLMQDLVRPSNPAAGESFYPRWVPDEGGRVAVRGIAALVAALKSEELYARTDRNLWNAALLAATVGFSLAIWGVARLGAEVALLVLAELAAAATLTAADIAAFAYEFNHARKTSVEADVALGTSPVTGLEAAHALRAEADAAMFSSAVAAAGAVGVPLFLYAAQRGIRPSRAAMENAVFYAERRGLNGLGRNNREVFDYTRGLAEYRAAHFGAGTLTDMEKRALRAAYPDGLPEGLAQRWKVRPGDTTLPLVRESDPSMPPVNPRAETASLPRLPPDLETRLPASSASSDSGRYRIDLREAAPERSSNPVLRRIYGEGEEAARRGNAKALARQSRLEFAESEWQRLNPAEKRRVQEAWVTFQKLQRTNPKVAQIDEAEAMSLLIMQAKRDRPHAALPITPDRPLPPNPLEPEEMAAIVTEWHRAPVTADELARAANISGPNAEASLKGARSVVDRFRGGGHGASGGGVPAVSPSGSGGTSINIDERSRAIAKRLVDMGVPADDAMRGAIAPASKPLDLNAATAGAAWRRAVPAEVVMRRLGVDREQLRNLLDKYHRSFFSDSPAHRAEVIDRYINAKPTSAPVATRPPTPAPPPPVRPPSVPPRIVPDTATEVLPPVDFPPLRVSDPVPGLYDSVSTSGVPARGWRFSDQPIEVIDGGVRRIQTRVITPDGLEGRVTRGYDAQKKQIVMYSAFLDDLRDSPHRWIKAGKPLVAEQGTPTVAYATMRQMKLLGVPYGGARSVKINRIENVEAVMQLKALMKRNIPLNRAVLQTHSVQYAETALAQSGHEIVSSSTRVTLAKRNPTAKLKTLLEWDFVNATDDVQRAAIQRRHEGLLRQYGLTPEDEVLVYYEIHMDLRPVGP